MAKGGKKRKLKETVTDQAYPEWALASGYIC